MYTYQATASKLYLHYIYIYIDVYAVYTYIPTMTLMKLSEKKLGSSALFGVIPPYTEAGLDHLMYKVGHQLGVRGDPKVEIR